MDELTTQGKTFSQLVLEIFRLNGLLLAAGDIMTAPVGLTSARWQVLGVVEHGPISVAHVARIMGLTRQSVQQTADGMEKEGFISYVDNPHHRRSRLMQLTPKARSALDYIQQRQAAWANGIGSQHALADLEQALQLLGRLRESLEQQPPTAQHHNT